jgi:transposase
MSDLFWLTDPQMVRLEPFFPKSYGKPRVDHRRVLSGIIFINRNGLRWRGTPTAHGLHKTLYNRWKRWSDNGVFARMMAGLPAKHGEKKTVMIEVSRRTPCVRVSRRKYLKACRKRPVQVRPSPDTVRAYAPSLCPKIRPISDASPCIVPDPETSVVAPPPP